ncbi:hypothetical protein BCR42DRAFT_73798 [Absidia repens]|uniref:Uncharacterized protein n=1 Tax=Absidia repens TaxID=90262 RepID=A0A1X2IBF7_9FUNG|nr:hypothetical protein BCR42DRAFT_73798 [Absidia repens]
MQQTHHHNASATFMENGALREKGIMYKFLKYFGNQRIQDDTYSNILPLRINTPKIPPPKLHLHLTSMNSHHIKCSHQIKLHTVPSHGTHFTNNDMPAYQPMENHRDHSGRPLWRYPNRKKKEMTTATSTATVTVMMTKLLNIYLDQYHSWHLHQRHHHPLQLFLVGILYNNPKRIALKCLQVMMGSQYQIGNLAWIQQKTSNSHLVHTNSFENDSNKTENPSSTQLRQHTIVLDIDTVGMKVIERAQINFSRHSNINLQRRQDIYKILDLNSKHQSAAFLNIDDQVSRQRMVDNMTTDEHVEKYKRLSSSSSSSSNTGKLNFYGNRKYQNGSAL